MVSQIQSTVIRARRVNDPNDTRVHEITIEPGADKAAIEARIKARGFEILND